MATARISSVLRTIPLLITIFSLSFPAYAKYDGGTGEPNDPYQIATAEDLMLLGESPGDYDKHFILTDDIDLDPNLPGRKVFDKAVIGFDWEIPFTGFFNGNGHTISNLTIVGESHLGLFMRLDDEAMVSNLGLEAVNINGTGNYVGALAGHNITEAAVVLCHSTGVVKGDFCVGGLVGKNVARGSITTSYSTITVDGNECVGGLVGQSSGSIAASYSSGIVTGNTSVGGLVGAHSYGGIDACYSTATVSGTSNIGGLVGSKIYGVTATSFWDIETSGQTTSVGGIGLTTTEMQDIDTYLNAGWDFVDEFLNGTCDYWQILPGDYPRLRYHTGDSPVMPEGLGTAEQPYLIRDARDMGTVWYKPIAYYSMGAPVDMSEITWSMAIVPWFEGNFDGNGYVISNLHIHGCGKMGMFSQLASGAMISNLGLEAVDVNGMCDYVGGLVGFNSGQITTSYINGSIRGNENIGGIVGENHGDITNSYSTGMVYGGCVIGGLVGDNRNQGSVTQCYSKSSVNGNKYVGGLLGRNVEGTIALCYSTGKVSGNRYVGGLVGDNYFIGNILHCVWDVETSGLLESAGGVGLTTEEMMNPNVLGLNGFANDPNWVLDVGQDYPSLAWEGHAGQIIPEPDIDFLAGQGTQESPYRIDTSDQLILLGRASALWDKNFVMGADINLDPNLPDRKIFSHALIQVFSGVFDGNDHTISCLSIKGGNFLGLFGKLSIEAMVKNLGVVDVSITSSDGFICGPVVYNLGAVTNCYSTGTVSSTQCVGGLVGLNEGAVTNCYSNSTVSGDYWVGGLVGSNYYQGVVTQCYSTGPVRGDSAVGGLVGENGYRGTVNQCYSTGVVSGNAFVGGLVGDNTGDVNQCYSTGAVSGSLWCVGGLVGGIGARATACFWDIETSSQTWSDGGIGKTTAEMQTAATFLEAGWDFVDETENGTEDIWWINEGQYYPKLWWQLGQLFAFSPNPQNGIKELIQPIILSWKSVESTVSHDVYLSQDSNAVALATIESGGVYRGRLSAQETFYEPGSLEFATTYYWRIDEVNETDPGNPCKGDIWSFTTAAPVSHPDPADNGTSNVNSTVLSWVPGSTVLHYDVYFGEDEQAVSDATPESVDVYIGRQTFEKTSFEPGNLELNKIYYWRVDAVDPINPSNIWKGDVWKFTTISRRHIID